MEDTLTPVIEYFNSITPLPQELVGDIRKYGVSEEQLMQVEDALHQIGRVLVSHCGKDLLQPVPAMG